MRDFIYNSRIGRWWLLYLASASLWFWDVQSLVAHATGGSIGSGKSPLSTGSGGSGGSVDTDFGTHTANQGQPDKFKEFWNGSSDGSSEGFVSFMFLIMSITFTLGIFSAAAGLMANSAKISIAIQTGNASAAQKHFKDHGKFYTNTAIAAGSIFILQMIALLVGMGWAVK